MKRIALGLCSLSILSYTAAASAKEWTYRLKVIDETRYETLLNQPLTEQSLESVTVIREIKVQAGGNRLPAPVLSNGRFTVCNNKCGDAALEAKPTAVRGNVVEFIYPLDTPEFRQTNVFYHLNQ